MKLLNLLAKNRNLSQYTLAILIFRNIDKLKDDPIIHVVIKKAEELKKLKKSLRPEEYFLLQNALSVVESLLVGGDE